jgi:chromosome segregation ATPase
MVRKGLVGAALGAGALALLFGTAAPSYVKTAFHRVRHDAKNAVPATFEVERVRQQIADLEPAIHLNRENIAAAEFDVERLDREINATTANISQEKAEIVALRDSLATGQLRLAGSVSFTPEEVKAELDRRFQHYQQVKGILKEKQDTLKAKQKSVVANRKQLAEMISAKASLLTTVEQIEAKLRSIEATQAHNEFTFDESQLSRVRASVADLEKRVEVMARVAEQEGRMADKGIPVSIEPRRDVLKDIDAEFGTIGTTPTASAEKSL